MYFQQKCRTQKWFEKYLGCGVTSQPQWPPGLGPPTFPDPEIPVKNLHHFDREPHAKTYQLDSPYQHSVCLEEIIKFPISWTSVRVEAFELTTILDFPQKNELRLKKTRKFMGNDPRSLECFRPQASENLTQPTDNLSLFLANCQVFSAFCLLAKGRNHFNWFDTIARGNLLESARGIYRLTMLINIGCICPNALLSPCLRNRKGHLFNKTPSAQCLIIWRVPCEAFYATMPPKIIKYPRLLVWFKIKNKTHTFKHTKSPKTYNKNTVQNQSYMKHLASIEIY